RHFVLSRHHFGGSEIDGVEAGGAKAIDLHTRYAVAEAGNERSRARNVATRLTYRIDAAENDVVYHRRIELVAVLDRSERLRGKIKRGHLVQGPIGLAAPARGAHVIKNKCIGHWHFSFRPRWARAPASLRKQEEKLQTSRDQQFHDLVGACVNAQYARITVQPRDRIFIHIAITTEQLQTAIDHFALRIGEPVFGHRSRYGIEFALHVTLDTVIEKDLGDCCVGFTFGEFELGVLELDDRLAEGLALL